MYPIEPSSLRKWAEQEETQREEKLEPTKQPPEPPESLKELSENITYIDPKTATMTVEEIEKEFSLNEPLEDEELDVFDIAVRDTPPLRFASGKTLEKEPNIAETSKSTTIEDPHNTQTPQKSKNLEDPNPHIIIWQIRCPKDKTQKIQNECLFSCKVWKRTLCSEYQKFAQTQEDLSFKAKGQMIKKVENA